MKILVYSLLLKQYGVSYIDKVKTADGRKIIYGYNKSTEQYSFWSVNGLFRISLLEICPSKYKALFQYRILSKGV